MWPLVMQFLRSNAAYITLPIAAVIGVIGYNLENIFSDKYTPYNLKSIQENRADRLSQEEALANAGNVEKLHLSVNILDRNLPPSLQKKN